LLNSSFGKGDKLIKRVKNKFIHQGWKAEPWVILKEGYGLLNGDITKMERPWINVSTERKSF
jgi:hypothetical protein